MTVETLTIDIAFLIQTVFFFHEYMIDLKNETYIWDINMSNIKLIAMQNG